MQLVDIINLFLDNSNLDFEKPSNSEIMRLVQIYSKTNGDVGTNLGGHIQTTPTNAKKVANFLSNKGYNTVSKNVKCYTYNNKKMYTYNNNPSLTKIKETTIYDFQYGDNYLLLVQDDKTVPETQFPLVNNYHSITSYVERTYDISSDITIILQEFDLKNHNLIIQIRITDGLKSSLQRLLSSNKLKQINNLLGEVSQTDISNKVQPKVIHKQ